MHAEEAGLIELELAGRERMRKDAEERAQAEDSGAVAAAQMAQQIASVEARLDALKHRLYFPPIKGFRSVPVTGFTSQIVVLHQLAPQWCVSVHAR